MNSKVESNKKSERKIEISVIKRIFSYVKPYRFRFFIGIALVIFISALSISRPLLIQHTLNNFIQTNDLNFLQMMVLLLAGIVLMEAMLQMMNMLNAGFLGTSIVRDLRIQVFRHLLKMRNSYYDTTPVGTLVTRSVSDIESLGEVFSEGFIIIFGDILSLFVFFIAMLVVNWKLTMIAMTTVPILFIATRIFQRGVKKTFDAVRNAVSALNTFVQEHISGMKVVQIFTREEAELKKFTSINEAHKKANIQSIWYYSVFFPVIEILSSVSIGLIIWIGVTGEKVYPGTIVFFIMIINMFFRPIRMLADRINTLQMGMVASQRVFKVLDTHEIITEQGKINADALKGKIEFKNVWFAYQDENWILNDISFLVQPGECMAVVGATGAGKSTIINLLGRYYDFQRGEILLDGINIREYDLPSLRKRVGVVLQDVFLFSENLERNISLFDETITDERILNAAHKIGAGNFIQQLPGGLKYNAGERGVTLSAGQRQIISFLRAFINQPAVLILDEATSNIDTETEILIQRATEEVTKGRTSIIVAHRLSTIQRAQRIIVLEQGKIKEQGTLEELVKANGAFKKLYDLQFV